MRCLCLENLPWCLGIPSHPPKSPHPRPVLPAARTPSRSARHQPVRLSKLQTTNLALAFSIIKAFHTKLQSVVAFVPDPFQCIVFHLRHHRFTCQRQEIGISTTRSHFLALEPFSFSLTRFPSSLLYSLPSTWIYDSVVLISSTSLVSRPCNSMSPSHRQK